MSNQPNTGTQTNPFNPGVSGVPGGQTLPPAPPPQGQPVIVPDQTQSILPSAQQPVMPPSPQPVVQPQVQPQPAFQPIEPAPIAPQFNPAQPAIQSPGYPPLPPVENLTPSEAKASLPPLPPSPSENQKKGGIRRFLPFILVGIGVLLLLALILSLLSQRQGPDNGDNSNQKVVLQWWGVFMDPEVVQPLIDKYQDENPNVTIEYATKINGEQPIAEGSESYRTELNRVLKNNDPVQIPDIYMVHNTWAGDYEKFAKTSSSINYQTFDNTFYPAVVDDFANNNVVYGVPLWVDTFAIVYNKGLLNSKAIPSVASDWPTFKTQAQRLTTKEGNTIRQAGFAAGTTANVSFGFELANILLLQNGVQITNSQNKLTFASDPDAVTALGFFKDFIAGNTGTWSTSIKNDSAAFLEEDVAMIVAPSYRLRDLLIHSENNNLNLDIEVAQLPQLVGQDQELINFPDYWGNMVALNRPNTVESWKFLNWLTQQEQLKTLSENVKTKEGYFGILFPRKDMQSELQADNFLNIYNTSLPFMKTWYMVKGMEIKEAFNEILEGNSTPNQGQLTSLQEDLEEIRNTKGTLL